MRTEGNTSTLRCARSSQHVDAVAKQRLTSDSLARARDGKSIETLIIRTQVKQALSLSGW